MQELDKLARDRAMDKIRKLLAMAERTEGNEAEAAVAAAMAEKLMRHYQIESSECVLEELQHEENFTRETEKVLFNGDDDFAVKKSAPWVGIIAVGCGRAFTCKVDMVNTPKGVKVRFSGYAMDVSLCKWVYAYLCQTVYRLSKASAAGISGCVAFRLGAATVLQRRLYAIQAEREADAHKGPPGTALVLVDAKKAAVDKQFGAQQTVQSKHTARDAAAYAAGVQAGKTMPINTNRPLEHNAQGQRRLA